jgi:hypothetical protein
MHFKGIPYLQLPAAGQITLRLPIDDFTPAPSARMKPCVANLNTVDLPGFVNAINRLIWEASAEIKQPMGTAPTAAQH